MQRGRIFNNYLCNISIPTAMDADVIGGTNPGGSPSIEGAGVPGGGATLKEAAISAGDRSLGS